MESRHAPRKGLFHVLGDDTMSTNTVPAAPATKTKGAKNNKKYASKPYQPGDSKKG